MSDTQLSTNSANGSTKSFDPEAFSANLARALESSGRALSAYLKPREEGAADLLSAAHSDIPVWAAAEPVVLRGDLFGLAGLVLMPLVGLVVGYRQAKAARDVELQIGR